MKKLKKFTLSGIILLIMSFGVSLSAKEKQGLRNLDKDENGKITFEEFSDKHQKIFNNMDKDSDGFISRDQIRYSSILTGNGNDIFWAKESLWNDRNLFKSIINLGDGNDQILIDELVFYIQQNDPTQFSLSSGNVVNWGNNQITLEGNSFSSINDVNYIK